VNEIGLSEKFKNLQPYLGDIGNEHGEPTTSYILTNLCFQITSLKTKPLGNQLKTKIHIFQVKVQKTLKAFQ
jgi:hypothetical protein